VGGDVVQVHRNQIIVWISINDVLKPFPAILDTGHGHNRSIAERQLARWSGAALERIGELEVDRRRVVPYSASIRIHRNRRGRTALSGNSDPLAMPQGISVLPDEDAPRLPLIGLRAIVANKLRLLIDGERRCVTLKKGRF
jgi:hypothetical protein